MPDPWATLDPLRPDWEPANRAGVTGQVHVEPVVTVITPTIDGRFDLLAEAVESVRQQTMLGVEHSVEQDVNAEGPAELRNRMLSRATTPLVAFLDDDDLLDPEHLELLHAFLLECEADVVWSFHRGGPPTPRPRSLREAWRIMERGRNVIPVTVLAKRDAILAADGFDPTARYEDYDLWLRMRAHGAVFACLHRETWTYRLQADSRTHA